MRKGNKGAKAAKPSDNKWGKINTMTSKKGGLSSIRNGRETIWDRTRIDSICATSDVCCLTLDRGAQKNPLRCR